MPTRILREGIITSEAVNALSERAELFYRKLMSIVDDYGRFFANVDLIRAACYPLRISDVSSDEVSDFLDECESENLILIYEVGGKEYLQLSKFKQQTRSPSKFPSPSGEPIPPKQGKIYFILGKKSKRIKFGFTLGRVEKRMGSLQTGSPEPLTILGWIPGTCQDEKALHKRFKPLNVKGEWFTETDELKSFIKNGVMPSIALQPLIIDAPLRSESESKTYAKSKSNTESKTGRSRPDVLGVLKEISFPDIFLPQEFQSAFERWVNVRLKGKTPKTPWPELFMGHLRMMEKWGYDTALYSLEVATTNQWDGIFEKQKPYANTSRNFANSGQTASNERDRYVAGADDAQDRLLAALALKPGYKPPTP